MRKDTSASLPSILTNVQKTDVTDYGKKVNMHRASHNPASVINSIEDFNSLKSIKDSNHGFKNWFK